MAATYVYDGEVVISACLYDYDIQTIYSGGMASATTIKGGEQNVSFGGMASMTMVGSNSYQYVSGGIAYATTVSSRGKQDIGSGSVVLNTIQKVGGNVDVYVQGYDSDTKVTGTNENGTFSYENGVARDFIIYEWGYQYVNSGGVASATTVKGGSQFVYSGGVARATTVVNGGTQYVSSGGLTRSTKISIGGIQSVKSGGVASATTINSGGSQYVASGGVTRATTVSSRGQQFVDSGGVAIGTKVNKAGAIMAPFGSVFSSVTLKTSASMIIASGNTLYGKNNFTGATVKGGTTAERVALANKATLTVGAKANMEELHLNVANANLNFTGTGNTLGSLKTNKATSVSYDVSKVKASATAYMLTLSTKNTQKLGAFSVNVVKNQGVGVYELSKNIAQKNNTAYTVNLAGTKQGVAMLNGLGLIKGTAIYAVNAASNKVNLTVAKTGSTLKGTAKNDKLTGTNNWDVFYGGKGNDTITGKNGRDVAVYDKTSWGKDTIAKTNGTMTLLFKDLKSSDIKKSLSGNTMTITKKSDAAQKITVKNWNGSTHNIVFGNKMTAFDKFINAASPTTAQTTAARNETFKKAGLASA